MIKRSIGNNTLHFFLRERKTGSLNCVVFLLLFCKPFMIKGPKLGPLINNK